MTGPPDDDRSQRERMLAGDLYLAEDPELNEGRARAARLLHRYQHLDPDDEPGRRSVLVELLGHIGEDTVLRAPFFCDYGEHIRIGARTFANYGLVALDVCPITIGDDVQIATNVQLLTATHPLEAAPRRAKLEAGRPITIGDNVWLGGGVIVMGGVTIGPDTVVGAGSVVTKSLPARVVAVGNPARVVRSLD